MFDDIKEIRKSLKLINYMVEFIEETPSIF